MVLSAEIVTLASVFNDVKFTTTNAQRDFQWGSAQVSQFIDDIQNKIASPKNKTYYFGSIALAKAQRKEVMTCNIFDGLQRLTTTTILAKLALKKMGPSAIAQSASIARGIIFTPTGERRLELQTPGGTLANFVGDRSLGADSALADRKLREAIATIEEVLSSYTQNQISGIIDFLNEHALVTRLMTESDPLAYQIFVTANSRGLKFEIGDIIKSSVLDRLIALGEDKKARGAAKAIKEQQKILKADFAKLIDVATLIEFETTAASRLPGQALIEWIGGADADKIQNWLNSDFRRYASALSNIREVDGEEKLSGRALVLKQLSFIPSDDWKAVYVQAHKCLPDEAQYDRLLTSLLRFSFIALISGWSINNIRKRLLKSVDLLREQRDPASSPDALKVHSEVQENVLLLLQEPLIDKKMVKAVGLLLETIMWDEVPKYAWFDAHDKRFKTLEHVLPRRWKSGGPWRFSREEHSRWVNTIGNICLIEEVANKRAGSGTPPHKLKVYEGVPSSGRSATFAEIVAEFQADSEWTPEIVGRLTQLRAEKLAKFLALTPPPVAP